MTSAPDAAGAARKARVDVQSGRASAERVRARVTFIGDPTNPKNVVQPCAMPLTVIVQPDRARGSDRIAERLHVLSRSGPCRVGARMRGGRLACRIEDVAPIEEA